jgi:hypothetical protein
MIYHLSLRTAALIAGALLCLIGVVGLVMHNTARMTLGRFPRSRVAGVVILAIDLVWSFWLVSTMEMGEFSTFRRPFLIALPIGFFLTMRFVDEFLAVRALGILVLLAAEPLLEAAFFRYETSRLVLTVLAYILIVLGLIWVTLPYKLRDQINWFSKSAAHWQGVNAISFVYGVALITLAFISY